MNAVRNEDAESAVLGGMLIDDTKLSINKARETLCADDFEPHKAALFAEICRMSDNKEPMDLLLIAEKFKNDSRIDRNFIMNQVNGAGSAASIDHYISIVKDCSLRRKALLIMDGIKRQIVESGDPQEILSSGMVSFMDLVKTDSRSRVHTMRQVMQDTWDEINNRTELDFLGEQTDVSSFNELVGGILKDCVLTIAGRPGTGKTTFTQQLLLSLSKKHPGMFASLEMNSKRLGVKMLANETKINTRFIDLPKRLNDSDWPRITNAWCELGERKLFIDDSVDMSASQIACRARRLKYENPDMLFLAIDYLQIIHAEPGVKFENRKAEINKALGIFKSLARELNICVIILSQILRDIEKRSSRKPVLADLKESGAIEEMSDIVLFLYQDDESEKATKLMNLPDCSVTSVSIAKNKYGPPDVTFDLVFNRPISKFIEFTR